MSGFFTLVLTFFLFLPLSSLQAKPLDLEPELVSSQGRWFQEVGGRRAEKTLPLEGRGSHLFLRYSSERPILLRVSYPLCRASNEILFNFNPIDSLLLERPPQQGAEVSLDLTRSPAWSPWRRDYLLQVAGSGTVLIDRLTLERPSFGAILRAIPRHFFLDEPLFLSSINVLRGYRVLGVSLSLLMGFALLLASAFEVVCSRRRGAQALEDSLLKKIALIGLLFLLLYDARFTLNLARTISADLQQWLIQGQYRQMGPITGIAEFLEQERSRSSKRTRVAVCTDGDDFLVKQLRYLLFPTVVEGEGSWREATHAVLIDTSRGAITEDALSCGQGPRRSGMLLRTFPQESRVVRFLD
jgi:hypothetical protein